MKIIFTWLILTVFVITARGQIIYLEAGKVLASFDYENSDGNSLDNLSGSNESNVVLGARMSLFSSAFHLSVAGEYNKYGATFSDPLLGNYIVWDASYMGANLGFDYEFFKPSANRNQEVGFSFYLKSVCAVDFLTNGTRVLNSQAFDLHDVEEFDKPVYFLRGGIGGNYYISRTFIVYAQYMFGRSILIGNYKGQEQLRFITHTVSIGLAINLYYNR
jgi:hypothetical protein